MDFYTLEETIYSIFMALINIFYGVAETVIAACGMPLALIICAASLYLSIKLWSSRSTLFERSGGLNFPADTNQFIEERVDPEALILPRIDALIDKIATIDKEAARNMALHVKMRSAMEFVLSSELLTQAFTSYDGSSRLLMDLTRLQILIEQYSIEASGETDLETPEPQ